MPSKKDVPRVCKQCGARFLVRRSDAKRGIGIFCSRSCKSRHDAPKILKIGAVGASNPNWQGGQTRFTNGYWYVLLPEHHRALKSGYVKRADLVMEQTLGRQLKDDEIVHHGPGGKEDDSPGNLTVMTKKQHDGHHGQLLKKPPKPRKPDAPSNRRYDWPSDKRLLEMRQSLSLREIASVIGCNHKAVDRRLQRIEERRIGT